MKKNKFKDPNKKYPSGLYGGITFQSSPESIRQVMDDFCTIGNQIQKDFIKEALSATLNRGEITQEEFDQLNPKYHEKD